MNNDTVISDTNVMTPEEWIEMQAGEESAPSLTAEDAYAFDEDDNDAEATEQMMQAGGILVGVNRQSILKRVVDKYIDKHKDMLKLDWLMQNRSVKAPIDGEDISKGYYGKPICDRIRDDLMMLFEMERIRINDGLEKGAAKVFSLERVPGWAIAMILIATGDVRVLDTKSKGSTASSQRVIFRHYFISGYTPKDKPIYKWSGQWQINNEKDENSILRKILKSIEPETKPMDRNDFNEMLFTAQTVFLKSNDKLVFYRNGVWDFERQCFTGYDDPSYNEYYDSYVCLGKFAVNHPCGKMWGNQPEMDKDADGNPIEPEIVMPDGTIWKPSEQLKAPFELGTPKGDATYDCYLRFFQFTLRGMNGAPHYYIICINGDGQGTNGKGTAGDIIELQMVNIIATFGCDDILSVPLVLNDAPVDKVGSGHLINGSNAPYLHLIRGQEGKVNFDGRSKSNRKTIVKDCDTVKNLGRCQPITWRDLYEMPMTMALSCGLWSEHNDMPIFADNSASMRRALLVFTFNKYFGTDKPWIKDDYIHRPEVRSWIAWYITTQLPCYESYDSNLTKLLQEDTDDMLKESLNASRFFDEVLPNLPLDVIPAKLLFDIYSVWCEKNKVPVIYRMSMNSFYREMQQYSNLKGSPVTYQKGQQRMKIQDYKVREETSIEVFNMLGEFKQNTYTGEFAFECGKYCKTTQVKHENGQKIGYIPTLDWTEFVRKNSKGKMETVLVSNCFIRKQSHFDYPIACELPVEDCSDPEYVTDDVVPA